MFYSSFEFLRYCYQVSCRIFLDQNIIYIDNRCTKTYDSRFYLCVIENKTHRNTTILFLFIHHNPGLAVGQFPGGRIHELGTFAQQFVIYLLGIISRLMVICMHTIKEESYRNPVFCKIIMVGAVIQTLRIIWVVIFIVKFKFLGGIVGGFINHLQLS